MPATINEIHDMTTYHEPDEDQAARIERVNAAAAILLATIVKDCPASEEKDHAIMQIRDGKMWANTAISLRLLPKEAKKTRG